MNFAIERGVGTLGVEGLSRGFHEKAVMQNHRKTNGK